MAADLPPADDPGAATPQAPGRPASAWGGRLRGLLALGLPLLLAAVLGSAALAGLGAWRALHTAQGSAQLLGWLAQRWPALQLEGPRGPLFGAEGFELDRLHLRLPSGTLELEGLQLRGLAARGLALRAPWLRLRADSLAMRRLAWVPDPGAPAGPRPSAPPPLDLPLALELTQLRIGQVELPGLRGPLRQLQARIQLAAPGLPGEGGAAGQELARVEHRVEGLSLQWAGLRLDGALGLEAQAPLRLQGRLQLRRDPEAAAPPHPDWPAGLDGLGLAAVLEGRLERPRIQLAMALQGQRLEARAELEPFAPWPLPQLDAQVEDLDLAPLAAALGRQAPRSALTGTVQVLLDPAGPSRVQGELRNARPGRWDQGSLPLAHLGVLLRGQGWDWTLDHLRAVLQGDAPEAPAASRPGRRAAARLTAPEPAGVVEAQGQLGFVAGGGLPALKLRLQLDGLQPARLDRRAPPLALQGPIQLEHRPPAQAGGAAPWGQLEARVRLDGRVLGPDAARLPAPLREAPVRVAAELSLEPRRWRLQGLQVRAGATALQGQGEARPGPQGWRLDGQLALDAFDPRLWWPGLPEALGRPGEHALNGQLQASLHGPPAAPAGGAETAFDPAAWAGQLSLQLAPSRLAGLAAEGEARLDLGPAALPQVRGRLALAGQQLELDGHWPLPGLARPDGSQAASAARLDLKLKGPRLEALAPLLPAGLGLGGAVQAQLQAEGVGPEPASWPWPHRLRGELDARGLRARAAGEALALERLRARWDLPPAAWRGAELSAQAPAELDVELGGLATAAGRLEQAQLTLQGRLAAHRIRLEARGQPAPGTAAEPAARPALRLQAEAEGAWTEAAPGGRWEGRLATLLLQPLGPAPAAAAAARPPAPLLRASGLQARIDAEAGRWRWALAPGRVELLELGLRWTEARGEHPAEGPAQLQLQASLDPLDLPALLARAQPDVGWGGDLRLVGSLSLRQAAGLQLQAELRRERGDLSLTELGVTERFRLSALRLAAEAEGGRWRLTQEVAGEGLGRIDGEQRLSTADPRAWPGPRDIVHGALRLAVDNLAGWAAWLPPGWRPGGKLEAGVAVSGPLAGPAITGRLDGQDLSLRHALEGVALREGRIALRFDGDDGELETLRFAAGEGELLARGRASFGAEPQARLSLIARQAGILARVDRRVTVSGEADLLIEPQRSRVRGAFRAEEGLIDIGQADAPRLGEDVRVRRGAPGSPPPAPRRAPGPLQALDLDLKLAVGPRLQLRGRGLDTRLDGELAFSVQPRSGQLVARGEIRTERGSYQAYGQALKIQKGVLTFVGDLANPRLDIEAVRGQSDSTVGVRVGGSASAPRVKLFSDPELPDTEKLALLVTGRRYDSLAGGETVLLQRAALALLAGESGSDFSLARAFRLDEFAVRQDETGSVRETVVTLGKQLSDRVYLGYERGLAAAAGNIQLIYRVAQRFTLRAQGGNDSALDLIWTWRWN